MKPDIRLDAVYPYPPERVWRAITDPRELAQWLMPNDFEARVGHKFQFKTKPTPGFDGIVRCEVIELDRPRRLAYRWNGGKLESVVRFTLEAVAQGTRLVLEHSGSGLEGSSELCTLLCQSWRKMIEEKLPMLLGGVAMSAACGYDEKRIASLIERYEKGGQELAAMVSRIPAAKVDRAPGSEMWSARQTALHIVDAEIVGATRLRMLAAQPGASLAGYQGNVWGREMRYDRQPLEPALELFASLRKVTGTMLRLLPQAAWSNTGTHSEAGEITLESCLASHCDHADAHMREIEALTRDLTLSA